MASSDLAEMSWRELIRCRDGSPQWSSVSPLKEFSSKMSSWRCGVHLHVRTKFIQNCPLRRKTQFFKWSRMMDFPNFSRNSTILVDVIPASINSKLSNLQLTTEMPGYLSVRLINRDMVLHFSTRSSETRETHTFRKNSEREVTFQRAETWRITTSCSTPMNWKMCRKI